ncbi:indole-3-glycerol phosphate synthase [Spirochaetia bacterium]|nr:indole-3-glycerol phosphate synthase [Spirochaetia bacterium]
MILDDIATSTRRRVEKAKAALPMKAALAQIHRDSAGDRATVFEQALAAPGLSFICEVKKASPSKGLIAQDKSGAPFFPYLEIAQEYENAGADAISVLTEPEYFLGSDDYLREIAATVHIPVLRKDFILDPYQIYEAKLLGASAVLLICALLDTATLTEYIGIARTLGLAALVEAHSADEVHSAINAGARIIGINNRDLKTFTVDLAVTGRLRELIPAGITTVSESGIRSADDIRILSEYGIDAVLIGETLMRSGDKKEALATLRSTGDKNV